jgi:hypothetical protein
MGIRPAGEAGRVNKRRRAMDRRGSALIIVMALLVGQGCAIHPDPGNPILERSPPAVVARDSLAVSGRLESNFLEGRDVNWIAAGIVAAFAGTMGFVGTAQEMEGIDPGSRRYQGLQSQQIAWATVGVGGLVIAVFGLGAE